jgi:serine/threonine-protein kinase HipA
MLHTPGPGGEHTMTLAGEGKSPGRPHILRLAEQADVSKRQAARIIDEVQAAVARWKAHAAQAGVSKTAIRQIAQSLPQLR